MRMPTVFVTHGGALGARHGAQQGSKSERHPAFTPAPAAPARPHAQPFAPTSLTSRPASDPLPRQPPAGPLPVLGEASNAALAASISALPSRLPAPPRAVLLCSAHFEESRPTVIAEAPEKLLYDYGGFPPESYRLQYRPPGAPGVAAAAMELLRCGTRWARRCAA